MIYFVVPILMLLYFEILGRWIFYKIKKKILTFSFPIGFIVFIAILYMLGWPISAFNGNFYHYLLLVASIILCSIVLIIRDIKKIDWNISKKHLLIFILFLLISIFISFNRTLGDPHGYDVLYYTNMISFNIGNKAMNTLHPHFGTYPNTDIQWITYVFQAYYYFIACFIYVTRTILNVINVSFETLPAFVWTFQILCQAVLISVSMLAIGDLCKDTIQKIIFFILLILFMGNFYYNNAFGFIGNNYRMAYHALATLYLFRYRNTKDKIDKYLFYIIMIGICGLSSTGTFTFILALFGLFFTFYKDESNLIKEYSMVLSIPILNIMIVKFGQHLYVVMACFALLTVIYLLNDIILKLYQNKYLRVFTIVLVFLVLFILSYRITNNVFDFNSFINNYSERQDMSWDYFDFYDLRHLIFNSIVLIPMFIYLIKEKNSFSTMSIVLIMTIFNPFCCTFVNTVNWVYYRCYDLIINYFTIILFINKTFELFGQQKLFKLSMLILCLLLAFVQIPRYPNDYFIPSDDYNPIYKIDNSELEVIMNVRRMIEDRNIKNPAIITSTFWMPSFIEGSTYLIGKEKRYDHEKYNKNSYELYLIFFPTDGWDNFRPTDEPPYYRTVQILKDCDYDILVVDYGSGGKIDGHYVSSVELIESSGYLKTAYSTIKYAVFDLNEIKDN